MNSLINITYNGLSGNYFAQIEPGIDDATLKRFCAEALRSGEVTGIGATAVPDHAFNNYVIDRFHGELTRFVLRPKVPFGRN